MIIRSAFEESRSDDCRKERRDFSKSSIMPILLRNRNKHLHVSIYMFTEREHLAIAILITIASNRTLRNEKPMAIPRKRVLTLLVLATSFSEGMAMPFSSVELRSKPEGRT